MTFFEKLKLQFDGSEAEAGAKKTEQSLTGSFLKANLAMAALNKGYDLLKSAVGDSLKNAIAYEETMNRQRAALMRFGAQADNVSKVLNQQASALQDLTAISDETIRDTQTLALSMGVGVDKVDSYVRAAMRLSNAFGMDLRSAMRNLVKTTGGLTGELGEMLPQLRALTKEQLKSGEAISLVNDEWGDFLDTKAQGTVGAIEQVKRAYEDLTGAIGEAILRNQDLAAAMGGFFGQLSDVAAIVSSEDTDIWTVIGALDAVGTERADQYRALADAIRQNKEMEAQLAKKRAELGVSAGGETVNMFKLAGLETPSERDAKGAAARAAAKAEEDKIQFDFGGGEEMVLTASGEMISQEEWDARSKAYQDALAANQQFELDMAQAHHEAMIEEDRRYAEFTAEERAKNAEAEKELEAERTRAKEEESRRRQQIEQREQQLAMEAFNTASQVFGSAMQASLDAVFAMAAGEEVALNQIVNQWLDATGQMLISQGIADVLRGLGMTYIGDPLGPATAELGAIEIASGLAMRAGSLLIPGGGEVAAGGVGGGGGGSVGGGGGSFATGGSSSGREQDTSSAPINITINGAVAPAEIGVAVAKALEEARRKGYRV